MKKQIMAAVAAVLGITAVNAQEGSFFNQVSLEASYNTIFATIWQQKNILILL